MPAAVPSPADLIACSDALAVCAEHLISECDLTLSFIRQFYQEAAPADQAKHMARINGLLDQRNRLKAYKESLSTPSQSPA